MPAPKSRNGQESLLDHLTASVETLGANNLLSLDRYYRSASLLLRQAGQYRLQHNEEQLYVMLLRYVSLVVETIPHHLSFSKADPGYLALRKRAQHEVMPELERLKVDLELRWRTAELEAEPFAPTKSADATLLSAGFLPELSWAAGPPPPPPAAALGVPQPEGFELTAVPWDGLGPGAGSANGVGTLGSSGGVVAPRPLPPSLVSLLPELGTSIRLPAASHATLSKHALLPMGMLGSSSASSSSSSAASPAGLPPQLPQRRVQYPQLQLPGEQAPAPGASSSSSSTVAPLPSSLEAALASLDVGAQQQQQALALAQRPSPYGELQLGPQEVGVTTAPHPTEPLAPGEACCPPEAQAVVPAPPPSSGGVAEVQKRQSLRDVHVSVALMDEFMRYAVSNTRRGIETCGILAGVLSANDEVFTINTLIVPKQQGSTDTVEMLSEEEIFEAQDSRALYPLGWIHTHPSQTCFLSSVDIHTHCGFQTMLEEAVAIVMAPRDPSKRVGIFRLTTPGGLKLIQRCPQRGFHAHPPTPTGQPIYELCGHVYLNPRAKFEVLDLR